MGNCLITKLKGVVNNPDLVKLDEIILKAKKIGTITNGFQIMQTVRVSSGNCTITVTGNGKFCRGSVELANVLDPTYFPLTSAVVTPSDGEVIFSFYPDDEEYDIHLTNKYNITYLAKNDITSWNLVTLKDLQDIKFCNNLYWISMAGGNNQIENRTVGDISCLNNKNNLYAVYLEETDITGNLSSLSGLPNLSRLIIWGNSGIHGLLLDLSEFTNLTQINISDCENVGGSVEAFVNGQIANGRAATDLPIEIDWLLYFATFGNNTLRNLKMYQWLEWSSSNKITVYVNTMNGNLSLAQHVFAMGATTAEISAWEAAGKTVHIVTPV